MERGFIQSLIPIVLVMLSIKAATNRVKTASAFHPLIIIKQKGEIDEETHKKLINTFSNNLKKGILTGLTKEFFATSENFKAAKPSNANAFLAATVTATAEAFFKAYMALKDMPANTNWKTQAEFL